MNPKLSIITVTYNAEKFIESTILSVGAQHFTDREFIVVDGLSGDATVDILKKHPGIVNVWISEKDAGLYDAMNKAIMLAQGDYIMFLNAGDLFFDDEVLEEVFKQAGDAELIYGDTAIIDTNYELVGMRHLRPPEHLNWKSFKNGMVVCHQAIIAKRKLVPMYDLHYRVAADIDWAIRLTRSAETIYFYPEPIVRFMQDGISTLHRSQGLKERYKIQTHYYGRFPTLLNTFLLGLKYVLSLRFISNVRK
ncbi:MAG: glycosyltransferase family 2 protein [Bacteroidia bacterium]